MNRLPTRQGGSQPEDDTGIWAWAWAAGVLATVKERELMMNRSGEELGSTMTVAGAGTQLKARAK
jgi:hypothetical protein